MDEPEQPGGRPAPSVSLRDLAELLPPVTMVTALLFYFGWARSDVEASQLGINEAVLRMSVTDYLLRSISSLFLPLVAVLTAVLLWRAAAGRLRMILASGDHPPLRGRVALAVLLGIAGLPAIASIVEAVAPQLHGLLVPLAIAVAVLLFAYALSVRRGGRFSPLTRLLIGLLVGLMMFWELSGYAGVVGRGLADRIADNVSGLPAVSVYAPADLLISAPGVATTEYQGPGLRYHYRYTGLRFLQFTGDTYFLLPDGWSRANRAVVIIHDTDDIRLQFGNQ